MFNEQYVRIKHILFLMKDTSTYQAYDDVKKQEQTDKAKEIYDKITAGEDFESFMDQNEDPGMSSYPNGYIFGPDASYVQAFKDAAFDMNIGEVRLVESDYGWHIMKKYEITGDDSYYESVKSEVKSAIAAERFADLLNSKIEGVAIEKDQKKIDSINVQNILFGE
ncbi:Foldase protein PrsA [bioreactor metagenome]|uniref:Foldase protein PrsA n=1 Tax=bioreactor metagenome TaxID=1076179 RepID=A0A645GI58_9ZZZZ